MKKVGFIGLGIMGYHMASNLVKAGYEVYAYDIVQACIDRAVASGCIGCKDMKEVAANCDEVITMLPNGPHVKSVVLGDTGLASYMKKGDMLIDMSSIAPGVSQELEKILTPMGIHMVDAPVSGGEPKAEDGTLAIMVGGKEEDFERAKKYFDILGSSAVLVGPVGSGNTCKLTNQMIVAVNIAVLAEGLQLAKRAGADTQKVFDAIKGGLAGSTVMNAKAPMMLAGNYKPGFKIDLHIKDLTNAMDTGYATNTPMPLTAEVMQMFQVLKADGCGQEDHSALEKYYEKLTGTKVGD